jgi:ATP-binding cassette subfamily B protein
MTMLIVLGLGVLAVIVAGAWGGLRLAGRLTSSFESCAESSQSLAAPAGRTDLGLSAVAARHRAAMAALVCLELLESLLALTSPWPLKVVVDTAIGTSPLPHVLQPLHALGRPGLAVAMGVLGVALVSALATVGYAATLLSANVSQSIGVSLQSRLVRRLLCLPVRFHESARRGDLLSRVTTDVGYVKDSMLAKVEVVVPKAITVASMTLLMALLSPLLAAVVLGAVPALALVGVARRRAVARAQRDNRASSGNLNSLASELLGNVRVVQTFGQEAYEAGRFDRASRELALASVRSARAGARLSPGADLVLAVDLAIVMVLGTAQVAAHRLSLGVLFVFLAYLTALEEPVRSFSRLAATLGRGAASAERIAQLLAEETVDDSGNVELDGMSAPGLALEHVSFAYEAGAEVLRDFSLEVGAGETVCLMGPSGSGKSTLLSLICRLRDPDAGRISIGGTDVRELSLRSLRDQLAFVPQDAWLVPGTIAENIAYGAPLATPERVRQAGRLALVHEFADRLPAGWGSEVGEGGLRLSGGQRRRVAIARAVVRTRPVLLLDEPTEGLDPISKALVIEAVRSAAKGRTAVIVTHDPELARVAQRVVRLQPGAPRTKELAL